MIENLKKLFSAIKEVEIIYNSESSTNLKYELLGNYHAHTINYFIKELGIDFNCPCSFTSRNDWVSNYMIKLSELKKDITKIVEE